MLGILFSVAKYFAWNVFRKTLMIPQGIWWLINGTYIQIWRSKQIKNYDWSAHVLTIRFRHKLDLILQPSGPENFITTHHSFQHPKYILKDNVTLYYVNREEAVLVESDADVDVAHSKHGSFMRIAQFYNAKKVILMPIHSFHKMAEQIGDVKGTLIFATNTGRCGSTLLSQIFEETGKSVAISEPDALNPIGAYEGKIPQAELDKLVISAVRILCKPRRQPVEFYALKPTVPTISAVPMFLRLFPQSKQVFMYREGMPVGKSYVKVASELPLMGIMMLMSRFSETLSMKTVEKMGLPAEMFKVKITDSFVFGIYIWAGIIDKYNQLREKGVEIVAIKYDDLVAYPLAATQAIFKYCDINTDLAQQAVRALDKDSQKLSPLNMKNLGKRKTVDLTPARKAKTDIICDQFNLPRIPESCTIDGTITHISELANKNKTS